MTALPNGMGMGMAIPMPGMPMGGRRGAPGMAMGGMSMPAFAGKGRTLGGQNSKEKKATRKKKGSRKKGESVWH